MIRSALLLAPALVAVGCSCNQDYSFPPVETPAETIPADFGSWLSMDTAPDGQRITMTYYDRDQGGIGFAVGTPKEGTIEWTHEQVDGYPEGGLNPGDRGKYTSHRVGPDGRVFAAYEDVQNETLRAAVRTAPGVWTHDMVDADGGRWVSMGVMSNGLPIVSHHDEESGTLRVAWMNDDDTWSTEEAWSGSADTGEHTHILVDGETVYIAFYDAVQGNLNLLEGSPGSWSHSEVDTPGDVGQWPSMQLVDGELWIAYHDVSNQDLKVARRSGGSWSTEVVDPGEFRGADTAFTIAGGAPTIVYFDGYNNDAWSARFEGGSWNLTQIGGANGAVGFHNEVATAGGVTYAGSYNFSANAMYITTIGGNAE